MTRKKAGKSFPKPPELSSQPETPEIRGQVSRLTHPIQPPNKSTPNRYKNFFQLSFLSNNVFLLLPELCDAREFSNERGRVERRAEFHKCRSRKMFTEEMSAYLSWITQAGVNN